MKDLLDKLSSYNIFNYLLPGILYAVIASAITPFNFIQTNLALGAFVYYFFGLTISRIGSLILDPLLKRIASIQPAPYDEFVEFSKHDSKIELLSEINNMYRTIFSMLISIFLTYIFSFLVEEYLFFQLYGVQIILLMLAILFAISYKKQTRFIVKRILIAKNEPD